MKIQSVFDEAFRLYGNVVEGYDFAPLVETMRQVCDAPDDHVIYSPSISALEELSVFSQMSNRFYGGMPIQIGCCSGFNRMLNCLEYHRDSEVNIAADDVVLLLAPLQKVENGVLDTAEVEAFLLPAGTAVQFYETTLHYAPCLPAHAQAAFRVAVVLPRGTNTQKPEITPQNAEDRLLWACNKWLIAHPDTNEAKSGAFVGLTGENIMVK